MSTYVMSDIHGCYDELMKMLEKIQFSSDDTLIIAGDYMDRGSQSLEMLDWVSDAADNVILLKGNHDAEFVEYVRFLGALKKQVEYAIDDESNADIRKLYMDTLSIAKETWTMYDYYETIYELIFKKNVCFSRLKSWADLLNDLDYIFELDINEKHFVVVHAGYVEKDKLFGRQSVEDFYIYARDEGYFRGGKKDSIIVAGHTPTISTHHKMYTGGKIFKLYNKQMNCMFYDVDCGAVFRNLIGEGNMACLRLDDEKEFYLYED